MIFYPELVVWVRIDEVVHTSRGPVFSVLFSMAGLRLTLSTFILTMTFVCSEMHEVHAVLPNMDWSVHEHEDSLT